MREARNGALRLCPDAQLGVTSGGGLSLAALPFDPSESGV